MFYVIERFFNRRRYFLNEVALPRPTGCRIERVWTTNVGNALCNDSHSVMDLFMQQHNLHHIAFVSEITYDEVSEYINNRLS